MKTKLINLGNFTGDTKEALMNGQIMFLQEKA